MKFPRYIPDGSTPVRCTIVNAVAYCYERENQRTGKTQYLAIAYGGKRSKPDWHFRFPSNDKRMQRIREWMQGLIQREQSKRERRASQSKPHTLRVGQVLRSSWGYDQTNVDYYEVTRIVGPCTVEIREISHVSVGGSGEQVAPRVGQYVGEPMIKRASADNMVRIASYAIASPWRGDPNYQTSVYAGH